MSEHSLRDISRAQGGGAAALTRTFIAENSPFHVIDSRKLPAKYG